MSPHSITVLRKHGVSPALRSKGSWVKPRLRLKIYQIQNNVGSLRLKVYVHNVKHRSNENSVKDWTKTRSIDESIYIAILFTDTNTVKGIPTPLQSQAGIEPGPVEDSSLLEFAPVS